MHPTSRYRIERLIPSLSIFLTGLAGVHRVHARWDANPNRADVLQQPTDASPRDPQPPTIFEAFPEQLGLRLRQTTGTVDYLVIERAERIK